MWHAYHQESLLIAAPVIVLTQGHKATSELADGAR